MMHIQMCRTRGGDTTSGKDVGLLHPRQLPLFPGAIRSERSIADKKLLEETFSSNETSRSSTLRDDKAKAGDVVPIVEPDIEAAMLPPVPSSSGADRGSNATSSSSSANNTKNRHKIKPVTWEHFLTHMPKHPLCLTC